MIPRARTVLERTLDQFTATIRQKPRWWEKVFREEIVQRWEAEASEQEVGSKTFSFALQQLRHQARQCGEDGIRPSPVAGVFESDAALGSDLQQHLLAALQPLRDVPDDQKDWHPGSEDKVLDLVHPSLFPLIYGLSRRVPGPPPPSATPDGTPASNDPPAAPSTEGPSSGAGGAGGRPRRGTALNTPPGVPEDAADDCGTGDEGTGGGASNSDGAAAAAPADQQSGGQPSQEGALSGAANRELVTSIVAAAESWQSPHFSAWKGLMGAGEVLDTAPPESEFVSDKFQWLPADVLVGADGGVVFDSYVNNMHPERHAALYAATARLLGRMLPLLERTLSTAAQRPQRVAVVPNSNSDWWSPDNEDTFWEQLKASGEARALLRRWRGGAAQDGDGGGNVAAEAQAADAMGTENGGAPDVGPGADADAYASSDEGLAQEHWEEVESLHQERRVWVGPTLPERFEPAPPPPITLQGHVLQVVVKYAEIVLTPERPEYGGGVWHVEGMENEAIAASCIAYLAADNISESRLHFRSMVADPDYEQCDDEGTKHMYGMVNEGTMNEPLGSVLCAPGCMLCWPNAFQHRVAPFRLADASLPGRRTFVSVFLVHPGHAVLSTRDVPPQQMEWHDAASRLGSLVPDEVKRKVDALREFPVSLARAKELRLELMQERSQVVDSVNEEVFERRFSLCEH